MEQNNKRKMMGMGCGILIDFQFQVRLFSRRNTVNAIKVTQWITVTAHPWTEPKGRGVKMRSV